MQTRSLIFLVIIAVIFVGVLLYFIPFSTDVDLTLNAVKVDLNGNEVGQVELSLNGRKLDYLFQPSRLDVDIPPFDDAISYIMTADTQTKFGTVEGLIREYEFMEIQDVDYGAYVKDKNYITGGKLYFSPDLTRFAFMWHNLDVYLLASVDDAYTTAELVEYFYFLFREPVEETETKQFDVTMYCVQIDSNGEILRDLTVTFAAEETETDFYNISILFSDTDDPPFHAESGTFNGYDKNPDRYDCFGIGYSADLNRFTGVTFTIDRDRTMFQMFVEAENDTEEIYVGSIDADFDPAAILEYFSRVHPDP